MEYPRQRRNGEARTRSLDHLLKFIEEGLRAALPISSVVSLRKLSVSIPAPAPIMDQFTREADLVVSAMGD